MNKWQIICPLAAMALLLALGLPTTVKRMRMQRNDALTLRVRHIAYDLERTANSPDLISIDPALKQALDPFLTASPSEYLETAVSGDAPPPLGDGTATHRLYVWNLKGQRILLRLQRDPKVDKFRTLSFQVTNAPLSNID